MSTQTETAVQVPDGLERAIETVFDSHRYALGYDGIVSDGEVAWLHCTCDWRENYEMPKDDIRLAEARWDAHLTAEIAAEVRRFFARPVVKPNLCRDDVTTPAHDTTTRPDQAAENEEQQG